MKDVFLLSSSPSDGRSRVHPVQGVFSPDLPPPLSAHLTRKGEKQLWRTDAI